MNFRCIAKFIPTTALILSGCMAPCVVQHDQHCFKQSLTELTEQNLIEDLIRLRLNLPVVHVQYAKMTALVTDSESGSITGGGSSTRNHFSRVPGGAALPLTAAFPTSKVTNRNLLSTLTGGESNQLTMEAAPVYDGYCWIYKELQDFACSKMFREASDESTIPGEVHFWGHYSYCKLWNGQRVTETRWFYVPCQYDGDFLELAMRVIGHADAPKKPASAGGSPAEATSSEDTQNRADVQRLELRQQASPGL